MFANIAVRHEDCSINIQYIFFQWFLGSYIHIQMYMYNIYIYTYIHVSILLLLRSIRLVLAEVALALARNMQARWKP